MCRRFFQGSIDHRGSSEAPGLVVTLVPADSEALADESSNGACPDRLVWGRVFQVEAEHVSEVMRNLDIREKNGYSLLRVDVHNRDGALVVRNALAYVANESNPSFIGSQPIEAMAQQIASSCGPSGLNSEYLFQLHDALMSMDVHDDHVSSLAHAVRALQEKNQA
mmetsp:Transcript_12286/g.26882  ORF Transcript_12286/g.26882 Transcript_12286/m.26882 type:complete len:166 (-) Transcript_12286:89-586(-)